MTKACLTLAMRKVKRMRQLVSDKCVQSMGCRVNSEVVELSWSVTEKGGEL